MLMSKNKRAVIWSFLERVSTQLIGIVISIILARLLTPNDYGVIGITMVFISLTEVFVDFGFAKSLIRKIDRTDDDLTTAFFFNISVAIIFYSVLWIISPFVAEYFEESRIKILLKILGFNVIFNSIGIVQVILLKSALNIRTISIATFFSHLLAGIVAIIMAYNGFGIYSLAIQSLVSSFIFNVILCVTNRWYPNGHFSKTSLKYLWNFGSRLLGSSLIGMIFNQLYSVIIGKYFGKSDLGYYTKANQLASAVGGISTSIVTNVSLPILSQYQEKKEILCEKYREMMSSLLWILAPISACISISAHDIIVIMFTEKWLYCADILSILVIGIMFNPISSLSLSLMQAAGFADLLLKLEFPKKLCYIIYICIGINFGVIGLAVVMLLINMTGAFMNMYATKKIIKYSYKQQCWDVDSNRKCNFFHF